MIATDPPVRLLVFSLASKGPSTHATGCTAAPRFLRSHHESVGGAQWRRRRLEPSQIGNERLRRAMPRPTRPVPRRANVIGSGTGETEETSRIDGLPFWRL
jgi:hypothetical protein